MVSQSNEVRFGPLRLSPAAAGAFYCSIAILGYGAANACMRDLKDCAATWVICNKELITVVVIGPWLAWQVWRRKTTFPRGRPLAILVAVGLATELIGNLGIQWGYSVVGLAVMIPTSTGFVLVSTALLGGLFLGEHISLRNAAAIALLIVALLFLGLGSAGAASVASQPSRFTAWQIAAAIATAGVCGTIFTLLSIALRYCVNARTSLSAAVVIITGTGVLSLGPISLVRAGPAALLAMGWKRYLLTYVAGVCNLVAFLALVRGLQLTTVLHVNMLVNAGQVTLAAVAGVLLFGEPSNGWLIFGIGLMLVGISVFGTPVAEEAVDAHV